MSEIDVNSVATQVTADLIKNSFNSILKGATSAMSKAWIKVFEDFEPYAERTLRRNKSVRILCVKEKDVQIDEVYVPCNFTMGDEILKESDIIEMSRKGRKIIITGIGGAGKTFFLRKCWITLFENNSGIIPIFIELRTIAKLSTYDIQTLIRTTISSNGSFTEELFHYFCNRGRFCFILDGFDETPEESREELQAEIASLVSLFPRCGVVVSSRPDKRFSGWQQFDVMQAAPFNYDQTHELIQKVPFESETKNLFKKKVTPSFFTKHESFLSNPLLCIMMMMTFKDNMETPSSMNVFYDQAFNTLFQWHDATKAWSRKKALDISQFRRFFSMFCLISYHAESYEFTLTELNNVVEKAKKFTGLHQENREIIKDIVESVNMMQEDGLRYMFIHRSFQEYFAAYAITSVITNNQKEIFDAIKSRYYDNVIPMAFGINKDIVIDNYIVPEFTVFKSSVRLETESPVDVIEDLGISFDLFINRKGGDSPLITMAGPIAGDVWGFSKLVERMRGDQPADSASARPLFSAVVKHINKTLSGASVAVSVSSSEVRVKAVFAGRQLSEKRRLEIEHNLSERIEGPLSEYAEAVLRDMRSLSAWVNEQIAERAMRGRSIEQLLDL